MMTIGKLTKEFVPLFALVLVVTTVVTFLWSVMAHGVGAVDWEIPFRFAIIVGIILTWARSREAPDR